jgi:hypothetical protein
VSFAEGPPRSASFQTGNGSAATALLKRCLEAISSKSQYAPPGIRHILCALGVEHALHKTVPVPVLAAGELAQAGFR